MNENDLDLLLRMTQMQDDEAGEEVDLDEWRRSNARVKSALLDTGIALAGSTQAEHLGEDERNAYYYVPVPLTVHAPEGTFFESVQVRLILNPGDSLKPDIKDVFPAQQYRDLVQAEGTVQIGISDVFEFVSVVLGGNVVVQLAKTLIKVTSLDELKLSRKFRYLAREALIQTSPPHADTVQWKLQGRDLFEQDEHLELGFIMRVPLDLDHVLVACEVSARKRNDSLRTLLLEDIKRLEKLRDFIQRTFGGQGFDALQAVRAHLENSYWNVVQKDLPAWKLDNDLVHTYD